MKMMDRATVDALLAKQRAQKAAWEAICNGEHVFAGDIKHWPDGSVGQHCQRCDTIIAYGAGAWPAGWLEPEDAPL